MAVLTLGSPFICAHGAAANDNARLHAKGVVLSGQVSNDGTKIVADDDNEWTVSNADALKGLEGRYISVRCRMNPKSETIQVLSVVDRASTGHTAHLGDSAFRR